MSTCHPLTISLQVSNVVGEAKPVPAAVYGKCGAVRAQEVQYKTLEEQMAIAVQLIRDVSDVAAENRHAIGALEKIENQKVVKPDFEFSKLCELLRSFKFEFYAFTAGLDVESEYDSNDPDDDGLDVESEYDASDPDDDGYLSCLAGDNDWAPFLLLNSLYFELISLYRLFISA